MAPPPVLQTAGRRRSSKHSSKKKGGGDEWLLLLFGDCFVTALWVMISSLFAEVSAWVGVSRDACSSE